MKNLKKLITLATFTLVAAGIARADDSVVGKWHAEFDSQIGTQKYTFEFKMDGTNLVGHAVSERDTATNDVVITDLKIDDGKISFSEPLKIQDNDVTVEYSGSLTNGELHLHRKVGDFAEYDIVAKRVMETSADSIAGKWQAQFDSQIGTQNYTYEFKFDGTNYTGTAYGTNDMMTNEVALQEFSVTANDVSFVEPLKLNDQDIRIEYKGTNTAEGIKFARKVGDFGNEDVVATRVKDAGANSSAAKP